MPYHRSSATSVHTLEAMRELHWCTVQHQSARVIRFLWRLGRHRASCTRSGQVKKRATPRHRAHDCACPVQGRAPTECVPQRHESERALKIRLSCNGEAHPHAADHDGAVLLQSRQDQVTAYPMVFMDHDAGCVLRSPASLVEPARNHLVSRRGEATPRCCSKVIHCTECPFISSGIDNL